MFKNLFFEKALKELLSLICLFFIFHFGHCRLLDVKPPVNWGELKASCCTLKTNSLMLKAKG
jgi:hypothetical protein